jgi:hypothetical protein
MLRYQTIHLPDDFSTADNMLILCENVQIIGLYFNAPYNITNEQWIKVGNYLAQDASLAQLQDFYQRNL